MYGHACVCGRQNTRRIQPMMPSSSSGSSTGSVNGGSSGGTGSISSSGNGGNSSGSSGSNTTRKRGRPVDPNSRSQLAKAAREARVQGKLSKKLTKEAIETSPCVHNMHGYTYTMISDLRLYVLSIPAGDQRKFAEKRIQTVHSRRARPNTYYLEKPQCLAQKLLTYKVTAGRLGSNAARLPDPEPDELQQVCLAFFIHATGRSKNFYKQPSRCHGPQIDINPERTVRKPRTAPKAQNVKLWLEAEGEMSCIMPDAEYSVLHYRTVLQAHAAYAMSQEAELQVEWAAQMRDYVLEQLLDRLDQDDEADEPTQKSAAAPQTTNKWRYGNKLLGQKGDAPEDERIATYLYFNAVWHGDEKLKKAVRVRKWMPFAKCDYCSVYDEEVAATVDNLKRRQLKEAHRPHLILVKREREKYEGNRSKAIRQPTTYLSLIIDGADAQRFALPHFAQASHASNEAQKIRMYLLGCISHGRDTYIFQAPSNYAQGHNVTIQVLFEVLLDTLRKESTLPPILFLQLDNTTKQNKGRFLYAFLAALVDADVFEYIYVSFLPVGHTHEDIDQFFSRISVYLRVRSALTPSEMRIRIRQSYRKYGKRPIVTGWDKIANVSTYLSKFVTDSTFKDVTLFNAVKFFKADGKVVYQYKTYPGGDHKEDYWRTADGHLHKQIFANERPDLTRDYAKMPKGQGAAHVTESGETPYLASQDKKWESLTNLFGQFPGQFTNDVVAALKTAWEAESALPTKIPFHWKQDDIKELFTCKRQSNATDPGSSVEATLEDALGNNLNRDERRTGRTTREYCTLAKGKFYVTRPNPPENENERTGENDSSPFCLCKIRHIVDDPEEKGRGIGAHVEWWEISTTKEGRAWITDPYHQNAACVRTRSASMCDWIPLSDFHDEINMVKYGKNQKDDSEGRLMNQERGIVRMCVAQRDQGKLQQYLVQFAQAAPPDAEL